MLEIALSCLLMPWLSWMFVKLFTPVPPVHVHVVFHEMVLPLRLATFAHCEPDVAPSFPHWSRRSEYWPAVTTSHWPQWEDVSSWRFASSEGAAEARRGAESARNASALENIAASRRRCIPLGSLQREVQKDGDQERVGELVIYPVPELCERHHDFLHTQQCHDH